MPKLDQRLQQKLGLKINPVQMQLAKMCELTNLQLEQMVKEELEENPALEEDRYSESDGVMTESGAAEDAGDPEDDWNDAADDDTDYPILGGLGVPEQRGFVYRQEVSFRETLIAQLAVCGLSDTENRIAEYVIGNLDEDGYLRRDAAQMADDLTFIGVDTNPETVEKIVAVVRGFDPPGIAAGDLRECLLLQLDRKMQGGASEPLLLAKRVVSESFDEFSKRNYSKIVKRFQCSEDELKAAIEEIVKLNPKPGGSSAEGEEAHEITPDFMLEFIGGKLHLSLNSGEIPDLRLSKAYTDMLEEYSRSGNTAQNREALAFVRSKLGSAQSFIEALKRRNATLVAVMNAIVEYQKEYFLSGGDETALKPMILRNIADMTGLDISTVSRVANAKYVETWFGVFPLSGFFTSGIQNASGEDVSVEEVKKALKTIIDGEDKNAPMNDDAIVEILASKGYPLARRTVAKYRTAMGIPVARLRRNI